jgi:hypothetical protein
MPYGYSDGLTTARTLKAIFAAKASGTWRADEYIDARNWSDSELVRASLNIHTKGAVAGSDASDAALQSPADQDFADALRAVTVFDRLGGRKVPLMVRLIDGSAAVGYWVEESKPIPISRIDLTGSALDRRKVAALVIVPNETFEDPTVEGDARFSADLVAAAAEALDGALLDPANAGSASKPASITFGATPITSTGSTLSAVDADLDALFSAVYDAGSDMANLRLIMRPSSARHLAKLRGSGGAPAFPNIRVNGGDVWGVSVIVTANVAEGNSSGDVSIVLVDADDFVFGDEGAEVSLSTQAMIEMSSSPTGATDTPVAASQQRVSLFAENASAVKVVRRCSWTMRKPTVAVIDGVAY